MATLKPGSGNSTVIFQSGDTVVIDAGVVISVPLGTGLNQDAAYATLDLTARIRTRLRQTAPEDWPKLSPRIKKPANM